MPPILRTAALAMIVCAAASPVCATVYSYLKLKDRPVPQAAGQTDADFAAQCKAAKGILTGMSPHLVCTPPSAPAPTPKPKPTSH